MEAGKIIISTMVFILFIVAFVNFGVNFGNENDASFLITDNDSAGNSAIKIIYTGVNDTLYNYADKGLYKEANESYGSFNEDSGTGGVISSITEFFIKGILKVGKSIMGITNVIFNVTFAPILAGIGIPNEIASVIGIIISSILLFSIVLMAWKLYRTGQ